MGSVPLQSVLFDNSLARGIDAEISIVCDVEDNERGGSKGVKSAKAKGRANHSARPPTRTSAWERLSSAAWIRQHPEGGVYKPDRIVHSGDLRPQRLLPEFRLPLVVVAP